jgi:hypothetical protein
MTEPDARERAQATTEPSRKLRQVGPLRLAKPRRVGRGSNE